MVILTQSSSVHIVSSVIYITNHHYLFVQIHHTIRLQQNQSHVMSVCYKDCTWCMMGNYLRREWSIQWNLAFNQPAAAGLTDKIWPNNPQFGCLTPGTIMQPPKHNTISVLDSFSKPKLGFWSPNFIHIPGWLQACVVRRKPFFKTGAPDVEVPVSVGSLKSCDKVLNWQIWNGQLGLLVRDLPSHNPCQVHETFCVPQECNNGPDRQEKVLTGSKVCSHRSLQGRVDLTVWCLVCWHPRTCVPNTSPWVAHRHSAQPHFPVATWNKGWHTSFWVSNTVFLKHLSLNFGMIRHWNAKRLETWPYPIWNSSCPMVISSWKDPIWFCWWIYSLDTKILLRDLRVEATDRFGWHLDYNEDCKVSPQLNPLEERWTHSTLSLSHQTRTWINGLCMLCTYSESHPRFQM